MTVLITKRHHRPYEVFDKTAFVTVQWHARPENEFLTRGYGMTEAEACADLENRTGGHVKVDLEKRTTTRKEMADECT